jgi:hypothetical protein
MTFVGRVRSHKSARILSQVLTNLLKGRVPVDPCHSPQRALRDGYPSTDSSHSCSPTASWHVRHRRYINSVPLSSTPQRRHVSCALASPWYRQMRDASVYIFIINIAESRLVIINDITLNDCCFISKAAARFRHADCRRALSRRENSLSIICDRRARKEAGGGAAAMQCTRSGKCCVVCAAPEKGVG